MSDDMEFKRGPLPAGEGRIRGDIKNVGLRRGNLERLLRYWRPIMLKEGGFRRCRVILANHPELYPLERICAWLHHETTGLWPNEGCHHPGMKNCRNKLKKLKKRNWSGNEFRNHLESSPKAPSARILGAMPGKSAREMKADDDVFFATKNWQEPTEYSPVVTNEDLNHAMLVLKDFMDMEPSFVAYIKNPASWEHVSEDENGEEFAVEFDPETHGGCCP